MREIQQSILEGRTTLGIEFGSTRIKGVLVDEQNKPLATGGHDWENQYVDQIWTYSLEDIWAGLQNCYQDLVRDVKEKYDVSLTTFKGLGISGMMHGYMVFNEAGEQLVPFRTWRNTITGEASKELTKLFDYPIPQRWSIAHLYQAILNGEEHVKDIDHVTTLAGYIHWKLTGKKVMGVGEASGMFPIDIKSKDFYPNKIEQFNELIATKGVSWKLQEVLPEVLVAGDVGGYLSQEGAKLLDTTEVLQPGIALCPPEGDAGTGMVATNSVSVRTGNVSAGTSVFAMIVLEEELSRAYEEIDQVTTPSGDLVAMVHCNNCTTDINAWVNLFDEFSKAAGFKMDTGNLFKLLYGKALEGDDECGGLLAYNYFSGEHITGFEEGRPLFVRTPTSNFNLANFMRVHLFTSLGGLRTGMDLLLGKEGVKLDKMLGHGGFFKTEEVGQKIMAAAINTPVSVMETAGEGGAWGIAVLASYMTAKEEGETLGDYLNNKVFNNAEAVKIEPCQKDVDGYNQFMERYTAGLPIERAAVDCLQ
jgi:sugar (pentulose or hexulose) kinase